MKTLISILFFLWILNVVKSQTADTVWLSSLDISKATLGWGKPGADVTCMGNPIVLNGITFRKGFGTHASSILFIKLNGGPARFHAICGIDDEEKASSGSAVFKVFGNKKLLWQSSVLRSGGPTETVDISINNPDTLILCTETTADGPAYDHTDWADAYFLVNGVEPVSIDRPTEPTVILTPKAPDTPRINGPKVYGARPGHDFLFRASATGERPMTFSAKGLPAGLMMDAETGIISGKINKEGKYEAELTATNKKGSNRRKLTIICGDRIALTPPLGWNSWNCFATDVDQAKVKSAADAMVNSGLADHGWSYINIDDCWMVKPGSDDPILGGETRDIDGNMKTNKKFPDMKSLADYVHGLGLKIGTYSGPGPKTCAGFTACYQFEEKDAMQFANWGFDYLKYDWCDYERIAKDHSLPELKKPYMVMRDALNKAPRDIVYSLCQYGMGDVWEWGAEVGGNCWRTTGDITDDWSSMESIGFGQAGHEKYAGPGHWNDPDMLVIGRVGWGPQLHPTRLSPNEQYTHISLWALLAAPLLIGCDMTQLDEFTYSLLTNDEVLDINQDPLGRQASRIAQIENLEVWYKDLEDGSKAVGLFNRGLFPADLTVDWKDLSITGKYTVRDLWSQKDEGRFDEKYTAIIPAHGVKLVRIIK
ncbi:MAG: NPCBM/NEW2 domain-containing protein [Bacteroidota bacterium]